MRFEDLVLIAVPWEIRASRFGMPPKALSVLTLEEQRIVEAQHEADMAAEMGARL